MEKMVGGFEAEVQKKQEIFEAILDGVKANGYSVEGVSKSMNRLGGLSYYVTFSTPSGSVYIRISDHDTGINRAMTELQVNLVGLIYRGEKTVEDAVTEIVKTIESVVNHREQKKREQQEEAQRWQEINEIAKKYDVDQIIALYADKEIIRADAQAGTLLGVALTHLYNHHQKGYRLGFNQGHREYWKQVADMKKAILAAKIDLLRYAGLLGEETKKN